MTSWEAGGLCFNLMNTGGISEIVRFSDLSNATEVSPTVWRRDLLRRGLSAPLEKVRVFPFLVTRLSVNEFTSLLSVACYQQACFVVNEAGIGWEGISTSSISFSKVLGKSSNIVSSPQVHQQALYHKWFQPPLKSIIPQIENF